MVAVAMSLQGAAGTAGGWTLTRASFPPASRSAPMRPKPTTRASPTWTVRSRAGPAASAPRAGGSWQREHLAGLPPQCPELCLGGEGGCRALKGVKHSGSRLGAEGDAQGCPECALSPASPLLPPASCEITTREYCDFMHGYFHEEATLCSQVSRAREAWQGMWDTMLAVMLMPKGFRVSYQEWDMVGMGVSRGDAKCRDLPRYWSGSCCHASLAGVGQEAPFPAPQQCGCPTPSRIPSQHPHGIIGNPSP